MPPRRGGPRWSKSSLNASVGSAQEYGPRSIVVEDGVRRTRRGLGERGGGGEEKEGLREEGGGEEEGGLAGSAGPA